MGRRDAMELGEEFTGRAGSYKRPLFLIAHQDDELSYAGLIQRLGAKTNFVWMTNGDGLYFETELSPAEYAKLRIKEAEEAVRVLGVAKSRAICLGFSEVEIYRRMADLHGGASMTEHKPYFQRIRKAVRDAVFQRRPDAVFTCAYQGGHPEHDLVHFFTWLAIRDLQQEKGEGVDFFHLPEYEYTILLAMRFHPAYRGTRLRIRLTEKELAKKWEMLKAYPSQEKLFKKFRKVFRVAGFFRRTGSGAKGEDDFYSTEEFGPVPWGFSYTKPPHYFDALTYMFDDFEGEPVTFKGSVLPIVKAFLPDEG